DLKEFADALGGALQRQKRIGADLQRMLVIQEGREARAEIHEVVGHGMPEYRQVFAYGDSQFELGHFNAMAQAAAKDIEERTLSISADEAKAAEHIAGAVNGCS
ncbi:MAG: hypothetical protein JO101_12175, partial [Candidatus Eremiobacteraeota bacterium]|nr:hypothetical protein [Candidatus Eremiobacteraeota bacterium]